MPYALVDHLHEREVSRQSGLAVEFMPHVAPHFRGLTVTANLHLRESTTIDAVRARYADRYADEPLLRVDDRSEEHTSELQSLMRISYAVFCLKKTQTQTQSNYHITNQINIA